MARALVSVYDKSELDNFARFLTEQNLEIVSSGGTARFLRETGIKVTPVGAITGFPEVLDGRVKTLHPVVHAGILARRSLREDMRTLQEFSIQQIDWVVVNLYPFRQKLEELEDEAALLEFIDIGGPTMIRAAAKNFHDVAVVCDPGDYRWIQKECAEQGSLSVLSRRYLAAKVFRLMSEYDAAIAEFLES
ncbi:MAG: IMP cyclohydrolase [bacterium]